MKQKQTRLDAYFLHVVASTAWVALLTTAPVSAHAGPTAVVAKETVQFLLAKFGKEVATEGSEGLAKRVTSAITKHGDDAALAIRKVGPRSLTVIENAGPHARDAIRLMGQFGNDALKVVSKPERLKFCAKHGDEAGEAMIRHGDICMPVIEAHGKQAAAAMAKLSTQNAQRMAIMQLDGNFTKMSRADELFGVVKHYGDEAMEFVWKHKGTLAGTAALAAFLSDPKKFLSAGFSVQDGIGRPNESWSLYSLAVWCLYLGFGLGVIMIVARLSRFLMWIRTCLSGPRTSKY